MRSRPFLNSAFGRRRSAIPSVAIGASLFLWAAASPVFSIDPVSLRSHSGQFFVHGLPLSARSTTATNAEVNYVRLDPTLLAVCCERIKSAVLEELAMKDLWRGKICISLHPVRDDHEPILITTVHYTDGWNYQMQIPEQVDPPRLVKSVVEVLLSEIANRNASSFAAELPLWLAEGLAAHLQATVLANFTLEPETRVMRKQRGQDPLGRARTWLRTHTPLSLNQLNWPGDEELSDANLETYQDCAQLFVSELLRLRDGRACLREMLAHLPENLNWQTTFLRAFVPYFQHLLDVDKWWSLHVVHLIGQEQMSAWPRAQSARQLDDLLSTPVQVRVSPQDIPLTTKVTLQSVLAEWDFARQRTVLLEKLELLQALRLRASQDSVALVDDYRQTIDAYLQRRIKAGGSSRKAETSPATRLIISDTLRRLKELDMQREALRRPANAVTPQLTIAP